MITGYYEFRRDRLAGTNTITRVSSYGHKQLDLRLDVANHSPDGFEWGYNGSGPSQAALAVCIDLLDEDTDRALRIYQSFKRETVGRHQEDFWTLDIADALDVVERIESEVT